MNTFIFYWNFILQNSKAHCISIKYILSVHIILKPSQYFLKEKINKYSIWTVWKLSPNFIEHQSDWFEELKFTSSKCVCTLIHEISLSLTVLRGVFFSSITQNYIRNFMFQELSQWLWILSVNRYRYDCDNKSKNNKKTTQITNNAHRYTMGWSIGHYCCCCCFWTAMGVQVIGT